MKNNKLIIILLIIVSLIFIGTTVFLGIKVHNLEKNKSFTCTLTENDDVNDFILRDEVYYDKTGKVIEYRSGNVLKTKDDEDLSTLIHDADEYNHKHKMISDNEVYIYDLLETDASPDSTFSSETWYKDLLNSKKQAGYTCIEEN